jgi:GTP-binding protein
MAALPRVAIVGRPNVGKSTLLNRLVGSRVSIVEPSAGVTRDRIAVATRIPVDGAERVIEVIDTGGVGIVDRDDLGPHVEEQIRVALAAADVVLFVVDARAGLAPLDQEVARRLRGVAKPVLLVVNKVEGDRLEWEVDAFRVLGLGETPLAVSAQNGAGIEELCSRIGALLPPPRADERLPAPALKIAIVGRRNSGKSTLVNQIAREERVIVSERPGTTRDAIDVLVERDGQSFVLIDTAGVRKRRSIADAIEFFSEARTQRAIRRADVVILLYDANERLSQIEKDLARTIREHYRVAILGANKWDLLAERADPEDFRRYLAQELPTLEHAPVSFLSATTGFNVPQTLELARELVQSARVRVPTGQLNRVLERALEARSPTSKGQRVRIYYVTQADSSPPTFVLFVNDKRLISKDYLRYLENRLREGLDFAEVPIHLVLREKASAKSHES